MKRVKILVVEDEIETLAIMSQRISDQGYDVIKAEDGEEAIDRFTKESPDLIVLDLILPKMSGFDVLKCLREDHTIEEWKPVIIVSARTDVEDFDEEFFSFSDYYIQKPCYIEDILRAIKFMLQVRDHGTEYGGFARG